MPCPKLMNILAVNHKSTLEHPLQMPGIWTQFDGLETGAPSIRRKFLIYPLLTISPANHSHLPQKCPTVFKLHLNYLSSHSQKMSLLLFSDHGNTFPETSQLHISSIQILPFFCSALLQITPKSWPLYPHFFIFSVISIMSDSPRALFS